MTRGGAISGGLLAIILIAGPGGPWGWIEGGAVALAAVLVWRGSAAAQILLAVAGLVAMGWNLSHFFRTGHFWPDLALIILGCLTLGFNVLGLVLDRYQPPGNPGREAL
jgi:hypothetical protein